MNPQQFGVLEEQTTNYAFLDWLDPASLNIGESSWAVFVDFAQAFDRVDHELIEGDFGIPSHIPSDPITVSGVNILISKNVRDLGIYIDDALSLDAHVNNIIRLCFFHLRQLRLIRRSLTVDAAHSLVRALIHSRLDYCNSIMAGIQKHQLDRLQSVLKAAARFVLRLPSRAHVSELMRDRLHWLDIDQTESYLQTQCSSIQMSAQSLSNVSLVTVYLVDHHPRTSIATILRCSDIDCSTNSNKNHRTAWFLLRRSIHMELASTQLKGPWYFNWCFQKSSQNFSI